MKWAQVKVGAVVSLALVMLVITIMNMGHGVSLLRNQAQFRAAVSHSQGLKVGAPVRVNGVDVGNVHTVGIAEDGANVEIGFSVRQGIAALLHDDAAVAIRALGLLGDKFLDLSPGTAGKPPLPPGHVLPGIIVHDFAGLASDAGLTLEHVNAAIAELHRILAAISQGTGTVSKALADSSLYDRSAQVVERLEAASQKGLGLLSHIERGEGTIGRLLVDPGLYQRASHALQELTAVVDRLNNQDGTLAKLSDPELYGRLEHLTRRGEDLLAKIEGGEGTIGKLVNHDELYMRADKLLTDLEGLVADVKTHPTKYFKFSLF